MNFKDLTLSNIKDYIQGYSRWFADNWRILPDYEKEQVLYRASQCPPECAKLQKCTYCKCDYPAKLFVNKSCNKDKNLPDLMGENEWKLFKQQLKMEKNENNKLP